MEVSYTYDQNFAFEEGGREKMLSKLVKKANKTFTLSKLVVSSLLRCLSCFENSDCEIGFLPKFGL